MIDFPVGHPLALFVGFARQWGDVFYERPCECTVQDGLFVLDEDADALLLQASDDAGTEIDNLFVHVVQELLHAFLDVPLVGLAEISEEQLPCLLGREELQFVGILDVHYLVANVVCSLDEIDEGMAGVADGAVGCRLAYDAEFAGNALIVLHVAAEEAELALVACQVGREWVLHDARQRAVCHAEAALATPLEVVREEAESVGIALEVRDVVPLLRRDAVARLGADVISEKESVALAEVSAYGLLAAMSERRVAQVVGEAGGTHNAAQLGEMRAVEFGVLLQDEATHVVAQAASHTAHLEAVGKPVVYEDAARQGEHLRLVLQTAEGSGEDKAVVVALKLSAVVASLLYVLLPEPLARQQLFPVHHHIYHLIIYHLPFHRR